MIILSIAGLIATAICIAFAAIFSDRKQTEAREKNAELLKNGGTIK